MPTKILKIDIFSISCSTGAFLTILKVAQVVPVHTKYSKLDFPNYHPISLLSKIEKTSEKLVYNLQILQQKQAHLSITIWFQTVFHFSCSN